MRFSLLVKTAPHSVLPNHAYRLAESILSAEHSLYRVFFLSRGVLHSHKELAVASQWAALLEHTECDLCLCPASLEEHLPLGKQHPQFSVGGLAQLVDASARSDRLLTF